MTIEELDTLRDAAKLINDLIVAEEKRRDKVHEERIRRALHARHLRGETS